MRCSDRFSRHGKHRAHRGPTAIGLESVAAERSMAWYFPVEHVQSAGPSSEDGSCVNLDIMSGALELHGHSRVVRRLATIPTPDGGTLLASGDHEGDVRVWQPETGELLAGPVSVGEMVWDLAPVVLRSGHPVLAFPTAEGVHLCDPVRLGDKTALVGQVRVDEATALTVIPSTTTTPDLLVVVNSEDVRVVDPNNGRSLARFPQPSGPAREFGHHRVRRVTGATIEDDVPVFVTERFASVPELWTRRTGKLAGRRKVWRRSRLTSSELDVGGVAVLAGSDGNSMVAVAERRRVELWGIHPKQLRTVVEVEADVTALASLRSGQRALLAVAFTAETAAGVALWDCERERWGETVNQHGSVSGMTTKTLAPEIRAVTAIPCQDGRIRVASAANDGAVRISEPIAA